MGQSYRYALALVLLFFAVPSAHAQIYVDADASGAGDGSSWADAHPTLQDALDGAQSRDSILVAEGVYYPDEGSGVADGTADTSFVVTGDQDGLDIYGGFDPSEGATTFADRDADANVTVLSGDIDQDDANRTAEGITPTAADISGDNSNHVLILDGGDRVGTDVTANVTPATVLDGVIVTAGQANGGDREQTHGGGLYCDGGQGIGSREQCSPTLRTVGFFGNEAVLGGAIYNETVGRENTGGTSSPRIFDATFAGNAAGQAGGGIYNNGFSGGISNPEIANAVFTDNSALVGGALFNFGSGGTSSPQITNATFTGNLAMRTSNGAAGDGGAIYNAASAGTSNPQITNTIFWDNQADADGDAIFNDGNGASATINYSLADGGDAGIANGDGFSSGTGNLDKDPQFADVATPAGSDGLLGTPDDGLRLQGPGSGGGASPAIDAGDNSAISRSEDLIGRPRTQQVVGNAATVDMGAYESGGSALPVELVAFDGTRTDNDGVRLTWRTLSEQNNAGFRVERRVGAGERGSESAWTEVGFVEPSAEGGTTDQPQSYRFMDETLPYAADTLRYRLKQVDIGGTTTLSDPVTVARSGPGQLELRGTAPNPARSRATVQFALPGDVAAETVTLQLYDVLGRQVRAVDVRAEAGRQTETLDVSGLTSGMYILRLQAGGATETRKLTVVR